MKFLVSGKVDRPGGPRLLILLVCLLIVLFESLSAALAWNASPPETWILAMEEIHVQFFIRGISALVLSSVGIHVLKPAFKNAFAIALFSLPLVHCLVALGSVWVPEIGTILQLYSLLVSVSFAGAAVVLARKCYAF